MTDVMSYDVPFVTLYQRLKANPDDLIDSVEYEGAYHTKTLDYRDAILTKMTMLHCETCQFWNRTSTYYPDDEPVDDWGWCRAVQRKVTKKGGQLIFVHPVTSHTEVATRFNFGCVLHEARQ